MNIQKTIDSMIWPDEEISLSLSTDDYSSATIYTSPETLKELLEHVATVQHNLTLSGSDELITDKLEWPDE